MPATSGYLLVESFPYYRGRAHIESTTVTSVVVGKRYQINFFVGYTPADETTESAKTLVGLTESFLSTGVLAEVRLILDDVPLFSTIKLYAQVEVLDGGMFVPGDVMAQFSRKQSRIEGVHCIVQCEEGCQTPCQSSCQAFCENSEETGCNVTCEIGCQGQGSQATCDLACQNALEYYCHTGAETACSSSCEETCQLANTLACTHACETTIQATQELGPPGEIDDSAIAGTLLFQIVRNAAGVYTPGGDFFFFGQSTTTFLHFQKRIASGATNATIAAAPWSPMPGFVVPTQTAVLMSPDGFQASDGALWIVFNAVNSAVPPFIGAFVSKSTDLGVTWQTPVALLDLGQFANVTIFEDASGNVVIGSARNYESGFQDPTWPERGEVCVKRGAKSLSAAALAAATRERLFFIPLIFRSIPQGYFGLGNGGLKMRYNTATQKYMLFFIMGSKLTNTDGGCAVVHSSTIETLKLGMPYIIFPDGILAQSYLHTTLSFVDPTIVYAVCEGRRRGAGDATSLDLLLAVSRDGGYTWENEIVLARGYKHDAISATKLRVRFPTATILDDGRLFVSHASGNDTFTAQIDGWLQRSYLAAELPATACTGSCEVATESTAKFVTARGLISAVDGIRGRVGAQLTRNAAGVPVVNGPILVIGTRVNSVLAGGFFYKKSVPVNATVAGINSTLWTRIANAPPSSVPAGVPKIAQLVNGSVWVVQGFLVAGVGKLYAMRSADLGVTWTAWSLVSAFEGVVGAVITDATGPLVTWISRDGYIYYKRFLVGTLPAGLLALDPPTYIIRDPDKKQTIPADIAAPNDGGVPNYIYSGFDMNFSGGTYLCAFSVGISNDESGQIWALSSTTTIDALRFATPTLVAPARVPMGQGLFATPSGTRVLMQNGELRLDRLLSGVYICSYEGENTPDSHVIRNQALFRLSYDSGVTWRSAVAPYASGVTNDAYTNSWIRTDRPQGWLTHTGFNGGADATKTRTYLQLSNPPAPCDTVCQVAFQTPCATLCEGAAQGGGCAASCEVVGQV